MEKAMIRKHLVISGKVQGVFFRKHAKDKADNLKHLTGFVANDADGTVSVVVEGPSNIVNTFVDWCYSGPSTAQVEKVVASEEPYTAEFEDFSIRY